MQYPDDVGVLASLVLNYVQLSPTAEDGDALFLAPNEPHAYLYGDIVECMAASDNVVRAGLTPKERDVSTLIDMLTYESFAAQDVPLHGVPNGVGSKLYKAPVKEFNIIKMVLNQQVKSVPCDALKGASIMIVISGEGVLHESPTHHHCLAPGYVYFIGIDTPVTVELSSSGDKELVVFRAHC